MEENKENVVEETTQDNVVKVNLKKQNNTDDNVTKVDLTKKPETKENETTNDNIDKTGVAEDVKSEDTGSTQEQKEVQSEEQTQEKPVVEEITDEKVEEKAEELVEETKEAVAEAQKTGEDLPENIQKLIDFMKETGGDVQDYVRLNQDYSSYDDNSVLREYYKQTKKHLTDDEISFLMEDSFLIDEENDDERDIKRKKLAL